MFNSPDVLVRLRGVLTAFLSIIFLASALVGYAPDAQAATACSDGIDNDGDGLIDYPADPGCWGSTADTEMPACSDGIDNDGDGLIDYPADPGCWGSTADSEMPACSDGIDNDGDGRIDFNIDPNLHDSGCVDPLDNTEELAPVTMQPGDIAIIQYRTDVDATAGGEGFSFIPLVNIPPFTQIIFTDEAWDGISLRYDNSVITSERKEHTWVWTHVFHWPIQAGTVINCQGSSCSWNGELSGGNNNTITDLSSSGEQIIAYQGDRNNPTFLYALSTLPFITKADVLAGAALVPPVSPITNNTTMLPAGLINGVTAHDFDAHIDNGYFTNAIGMLSGTREEMLEKINVDTNWTLDNGATTPFQLITSLTVQPRAAPRISVASSTAPQLRSSLLVVTVGDATDALATDGIDFLLLDGIAPISSAGLYSSSWFVVDPSAGGFNIQIVGNNLNLKITAKNAGVTDITISVSDGTLTHSYVVTVIALPPVSGGGRRYQGIADASAAIPVGNGKMLVAADEHVGFHDGIYLYNQNQSGKWTANLDISWESGLFWIPLLTDPPSELDLEGSLRDGNTSWWIGSSSNNKNGKCRDNRHGLYKVDLNFDTNGIYQSANLVGWRRDIRAQFVAWDNADIHQRGPSHYGFLNSHDNCWIDIDLPSPWINIGSDWIAKRIDGINIEGLARAPLGSAADEALIGFRAPIVPHTLSGGTLRTRALLVPTILNVDPSLPALAFGTPIELDLGGRGVRSIARNDQGEYLIIAGSYGEHGEPTAAAWVAYGGSGPPPNDFRLYTWSGKDPDITRHPADAPVLQAVDLTTLRHGTGSFEGIVEVPNPLTGTGSPVQLIVDDGVKIDLDIPTAGLDDAQKFLVDLMNREAKLMAPFMQSFRSYVVNIDTHVCFATADNGATVYGSSDAQAIQNAVHDAGYFGTVRIAGRCEGESFEIDPLTGLKRNLGAAIEIRDKSLTLMGGYSKNDWTFSDPFARPTVIAPGTAIFTIELLGLSTGMDVTIRNLEIQGAAGQQINVGFRATVDLAVWNTADNGPGSLRQLIADVPAVDSVLTFEQGLSGQTITLGGAQLLINKNIVIDASGLPGGLTISGDVTGDGSTTDDSRIFEVGAAGNVTLRGLTLTGGRADLGGAIRNSAGVLTLEDTTVLANNATNQGGAIYNISGTVTLNRVTLSGNSAAGVAGAIFNTIGGTLSLSNSTLTGNTAYWNGGAILNEVSTLNIVHTTISSNTLGNTATGIGGGIDNAGGTVNIGNSIVAGNSGPPTGNGPDIGNRNGGAIITTGNNLIGDNGMVSAEFPAGSPNINGDIVGIPALLAPLGDYGGPTQTMPPQLGSPAIDAGATSSLTTDQRGYPRPAGAGPDIGAVEVLVVSTLVDENDTGLGLGTGDSLREIIAATPSGTTIYFDAGLSGQTITLGGTQLTIDKNLIIDASSLPGGLTISGDVTGDGPTPDDSRIIEITAGQTVELIGLTLTGGHLSSPTEIGGGISSTNSSLTLTDMTLSDNSAQQGGGLYSGDTSGSPGTLTINNSTVLNNTATSHGGGIRNFGSHLNINNSTISGNTSMGGSGGGIMNQNSASGVITNSTFSGNYALLGAGVYNTGSSTTFTNSTVAGNTATNVGGGAIFNNSSGAFTHTTIAGNSSVNGGGGIDVRASISIEVSFDNSIVAGNSSASGADINYISGTLTATGTNLIGDNSTVTGYFTADNLLVGTAASPVNPALAPLGNYGGPTQTMPPQPGSPAIDTAAVGSLTSDQRGAPRPVGSGPDIGAVEEIITNVSPVTGQIDVSPLPTLTWSGFLGATYEVFLNSGSGFQSLGQTTNTSLTITAPLPSDTEIQWRIDTTIGTDIFTGSIRSFTTIGPLMVTTIIDENDAGLGLGAGDSLREVMAAASPGLSINFNAGLSGQAITLGGTQLTIDKTLIIDASGLPGGLTISGDVTGDGPTPDDSRIFEIVAGITTTLKGLTITGGNTTGDGGGILNHGILDLFDSMLFNNTATSGGALRNDAGGTATLERCTLFDNNATQQGGAIYSFGNMALTNTTITGNTAPVAGGGIAAWNATYTLVNTTVTNNGGASNGGGVFIGSGILNIEDSIVAGNTSTYTGADIRNQGSNVIPAGANFIGDNNSVSVEFPAGLLHGTTASPLDPMLAPLGDYGGPTLAMHPLDGSPAIDATAVSSLTTDQRGVLRPFGTNNDIGAVEAGDVDNDGLIDSLELSIGSSPLLTDTDGDGLSDYAEVNYDGDATTYTPGADLNPASVDTDGDGIWDNADPIPLSFNFADADLAPLGAPDGVLNAADMLIATRIVMGLLAPTDLELAHGDLYPAGAPDGLITMPDLLLIMKAVQGLP